MWVLGMWEQRPTTVTGDLRRLVLQEVLTAGKTGFLLSAPGLSGSLSLSVGRKPGAPGRRGRQVRGEERPCILPLPG